MKFLPIFIALVLVCLVAEASEPVFVLNTPSGSYPVVRFNHYYWVSFDLKSPVPLQLTSNVAIRSAEISPKSKPVAYNLADNKLNFRLEHPGYHVLRINDSIKVFLFAEKPETPPGNDKAVNIVSNYQVDPTGRNNETAKIQRALDDISGSQKVLFFPRGIYKSEQLKIRSNSRIYLERGAILSADTTNIDSFSSSDEVKTKRFIYLNGAKNVEIGGYGTINGNGRIIRAKYGDEGRMRLLLAVNCTNLLIEGLQLQDPGSWNTQILLSEEVAIRNVKLLNNLDLSNTDGFDPDGSRHLTIENCFACCSDDNVAVKTTGSAGKPGNVEDINIRGCVFLTKKSALKVGTETRGEIMKNITFDGNDVIESDRGMALYVSDGAILDHILYANNHFERNYPDQQQKAFHFVVSKRNPESKLGKMHHILLKNNYFENPFPRKSLVRYDGEGIGIEVRIENLFISGKKVDSAESAGILSNGATVTITK